MFSKEMILKIMTSKEVKDVPLKYQSIMIHAIERILESDTANNQQGNNHNVNR